uniref:Thiolase_N domain-containing protein n=1 Tax=Echinostoma caproni TaxID=27848 RepID=A0A183ASR8_9TREM
LRRMNSITGQPKNACILDASSVRESVDCYFSSPVSEPHRCTCCDPHGPAEVIPISGTPWVKNPAQESGEYPYAARLLPSRAIVAAGSGFQEVRVVGRDTLLPIARVPMDSVVQTLDTILDGRYIGAGCSSGTVAIIGLA